MRILLIDINFEKNSLFTLEFVKPILNIVKIVEKDITIIFYKNLTIKQIENFDKIIICGTGLKDTNYLDNLNKFEWISTTKKQILGICGGAQIIGKLFGANLIDKKEIGIIKIEKLQKNILFEEKNLLVYSLHKYSLINLDKFEIIARDKNSTQIIKVKDKEIYGILFHPEIKNKNIILNFIKN